MQHLWPVIGQVILSIYVMAARGGIYKDLPADTQTGFVTSFFNFIGIRDIEFVYAEGLNIDAASKARALEAAGEQIDRLAA